MPVIGTGNRMGSGLKSTAANSNYISLVKNPDLNFQYNSNFSISFTIVPVFSDTTQTICNNLYADASGMRGWALFYNTSNNVIGFWITTHGTTLRNYIDFHSPKSFSGGLHFTFIKSGTNVTTDYNMMMNNELITNKQIAGGGAGTLGTNAINYTGSLNEIGCIRFNTARSLYNNSYLYNLSIANRAITAAENKKLYLNDNENFRKVIKSDVLNNWNFEHKSGTILEDSVGVSPGTLVNFNTTPGASNQWVNENLEAHLAA